MYVVLALNLCEFELFAHGCSIISDQSVLATRSQIAGSGSENFKTPIWGQSFFDFNVLEFLDPRKVHPLADPRSLSTLWSHWYSRSLSMASRAQVPHGQAHPAHYIISLIWGQRCPPSSPALIVFSWASGQINEQT